MSPDQLLAHFDRISDAPGAVARMRQFILELAVRGKLVDQIKDSESADHLLKVIMKEKERRLNSGLIKKKDITQSLPVKTDDTLFVAPMNWRWERLGNITEVVMGTSPPGDTYNKSGAGIPLINGPVEFTDGPFGVTVINQYTTLPTAICEKGDFLICVRGSTTGRTNVAGFRACIGRGVAAIRPYFDSLYIRLFIWRLRASIIAMGRGIAFPSVSRQQLIDLPIPLPPLEEQKRIVAKVDELMGLCDRLEAAQKEREARRDKLAAASLARLNNPAEDPATFREHAQFHLTHLPRLTTRPDQIASLRQTILSLAVRGKLVRQDPKDDPAKGILESVSIERKKLVEAGRVRREKPLAEITPEQVPFEIPPSWVWAKIGDASLFTEYGTSEKSHSDESGTPVLKMGDIQNGILVLGGQKTIPNSSEDLPALYLDQHDLLYNRTNSAELVGKTGIFLGKSSTYTFASYLIRIRCSKKSTEPLYFNLAMNAPYFRESQIVPHLKQQCGQANVNGTILKNMIVPLPPLAEQKRIVAKVNELMALCDQLEASLTTQQTENARLLEAILHEALAPA